MSNREHSDAVSGEETTGTETPVEAKPAVKVIDSHATPEEIAAIVTVLSALGGGVAPIPKPARSQWAHPARQMAPVPAAGRGGWRASALPR